MQIAVVNENGRKDETSVETKTLVAKGNKHAQQRSMHPGTSGATQSPKSKALRVNPTRNIRIEKVVLNVGCGADKEPETAKYMLEKITKGKAVITFAKKRTTWGVGKGNAIGAKLTLRKNPEVILQVLLKALDNRIKRASFDETGNVAFGIKEYMEIPGMEYDSKIGMMGFDICISFERPGYRVKKKKLSHKVGRAHRIKPEEAIDFMTKTFGIKIVEKGEE